MNPNVARSRRFERSYSAPHGAKVVKVVHALCIYRRSGNFHVKNNLREKFSVLIFHGFVCSGVIFLMS